MRAAYDSLDLDDRDDYSFDDECKQAEWPKIFDHGFIKKPIVVVTWGCLIVGVLHLIAIIGILVAAMVTNQVAIDSEFALYKNTRFKECAAAVPDPARCDAIWATMGRGNNAQDFLDYADIGRYYILWAQTDPDTTTSPETSYDWCQMANCLHGYKVTMNYRIQYSVPIREKPKHAACQGMTGKTAATGR
ncbi:hypothetical protein BDV12DRAFT_199702 [Aspergillus spectabilis]